MIVAGGTPQVVFGYPRQWTTAGNEEPARTNLLQFIPNLHSISLYQLVNPISNSKCENWQGDTLDFSEMAA
jgi:hypothetical protein